MHKILEHLKQEWWKYGLETIVVVIGVLIALGLSNWNEHRKSEIHAREFAERLIKDIRLDTTEINQSMKLRNSTIEEIDGYFNFFNSGKATIEAYIDSSEKVIWELYRYFPINYTFEEMQSSGSLNLLSSELQQSLVRLANAQELAQLKDEKLMEAFYWDQQKLREFFPRKPKDHQNFYTILGMKEDPYTLSQGLLHRHNMFMSLRVYHSVAIRSGEDIILKSVEVLESLEKSQTNQ